MTLPFGQYEVILLVNENGRVIDVDAIRVVKDFLSPEQIVRSSRVVNVDDFYQE